MVRGCDDPFVKLEEKACILKRGLTLLAVGRSSSLQTNSPREAGYQCESPKPFFSKAVHKILFKIILL